MKSTLAIAGRYPSLAGLPAISVPAGFGPSGLPMGLQLIGRPQSDLAVLQIAAAYEVRAADILERQPGVLGQPAAPVS